MKTMQTRFCYILIKLFFVSLSGCTLFSRRYSRRCCRRIAANGMAAAVHFVRLFVVHKPLKLYPLKHFNTQYCRILTARENDKNDNCIIFN